jgi:hypothetical protein
VSQVGIRHWSRSSRESMVQTRISHLDLSLAHHTASPTLEHNDFATRASRWVPREETDS